MTSVKDVFKIDTDNNELFQQALTHPSYTGEKNIDVSKSYERLEFLGDAVLKLCVSDVLYRKFPDYPEGELTKIRSIIISDNVLAKIAKDIGLSDLVIMSKQQEKTGGRNLSSIGACVFEAVLGAYYLDGKEAEICEFLKNIFCPYIKDVDDNVEKYNAKAVLQEYTQSMDKYLPVYEILEEIGPAHNRVFKVGVSYNDEVLAIGEGKTKKEAEQKCAYEACKKLGVIK